MKRLLYVAVMAVALLAPVVSAQAAPAHQTVAHSQSVIAGIRIFRTPHRAAHSLGSVNCTGHSTFWREYVGSRNDRPDTVLQADLWLRFDSAGWCGSAYAEGEDRLIKNCHTFEGGIFPGRVGMYDVYHCTATEYTFTGPVVANFCPSGSTMDAFTETDDYPLGQWDLVNGQYVNC
jgi:hypothetical protein